MSYLGAVSEELPYRPRARRHLIRSRSTAALQRRPSRREGSTGGLLPSSTTRSICGSTGGFIPRRSDEAVSCPCTTRAVCRCRESSEPLRSRTGEPRRRWPSEGGTAADVEIERHDRKTTARQTDPEPAAARLARAAFEDERAGSAVVAQTTVRTTRASATTGLGNRPLLESSQIMRRYRNDPGVNDKSVCRSLSSGSQRPFLRPRAASNAPGRPLPSSRIRFRYGGGSPSTRKRSMAIISPKSASKPLLFSVGVSTGAIVKMEADFQVG